MGQRTVQRRQPSTGIVGQFRQFLTLGVQAKGLTARATEIKNDLMSFAEEHGEPDEKGHLNYSVPETIEVFGVKFTGFQRQRRVSQSFDADAAQRLCEEKGFDKADYIETIEMVSQDKVARLYAEDKITEEEFDALITESISWAFIPVKG